MGFAKIWIGPCLKADRGLEWQPAGAGLNQGRPERNPPERALGRTTACGEDCLLIPIWLGLSLSLLGFILLTVFGLIWPGDPGGLNQWGFKIGIALLLLGFVLTIAGA